MLQVDVSFPSGCGETLALPQNSTVGELKVVVQKSFRQGFLKLVTEKEHVLTNPEDSLLTAGIQEGAHLTVVAQQPKVAATSAAFAMWCCGAELSLGAAQNSVVTALQFKISSNMCGKFRPQKEHLLPS